MKLKTVFLIMALCMVLAGCGKGNAVAPSESGSDNSDANATSEAPDLSKADIPFLITVTDKNIIYVEVKKDFYDPSVESTSTPQAFLEKEDGSKVFGIFFCNDKDFAQVQLGYGDPGDEEKTMVSEHGIYEDLGDTVKFKITLEEDGKTISGGKNHALPEGLMESVKVIHYLNKNDEFISVPSEDAIFFDIDYAAIEKKKEGKDKLNELIIENDTDKEFLIPKTSDDYRVEIYDIDKAPVFKKTAVVRPPGGPLVFGVNPQEEPEYVHCKLIRVCEYNKFGGLISYAEKTEYDSEYDACHVIGANCHDQCSYCFYTETGKDEVPEDFSEEYGLKEICDRIMPEYLKEDAENHGYSFKHTRVENCHYIKYDNLGEYAPDEPFFASYGENYFVGTNIGGSGLEYSADNCDDEGYIYLDSDGNKATVYYSKVDNHTHNLTYKEEAEDTNTVYPSDFVSMEYDDKYFTPASDDYILFYSMYEDYGDYQFNHYAVLVSFDASGNVIDAKERMFRPSNTVNPMQELIDLILAYEGSELIYNDDSYAYFDVKDTDYFDGMNKQKLIDENIDETNITVPLYGASADNGMFVSKK